MISSINLKGLYQNKDPVGDGNLLHGGCLKKKINYSLETCCGVVLCCVVIGNEVEIKSKQARISFCSFFNIPPVDHYSIHTYIYMHRLSKQLIAVLRPLFWFCPGGL